MRWRRTDLAFFVGVALGLFGLAIYLLPLFVEKLGTDDFATIWVGPRALILGHDPYDAATWRDVAIRAGSERNPSIAAVYLYPPWVTLALLPLALLSAEVAAVLWTGFGMIAAILGVRALLDAYLPGDDWAHGIVGFVLVLSAGAGITFVTGQWTFLFVAGLSVIVLALSADRPVAAGLASLVMLAKPPLFVFSAFGLALRALRQGGAKAGAGRRFVLVAIGAGGLTIAISWLLIPTWWPSWVIHIAAVQVGIQPVTAETLFSALFGPLGPWLAAAFVLGGTLVALRFDPRAEAWLPVWFALSSAAVIYSNTYDALLLIVPLVLATGTLRSRSPMRSRLVLIAGALMLFPVSWYLHTFEEGGLYAAVAPVGLFVIIAAALWPWRQDVDSTTRGSGASAPGTAGSSRP